MLEATRKTLVKELDDRFKQLYVLKEFQKLIDEFHELKQANVKTVVGKESEPIESQVSRSLESVLSDIESLSNSVSLESATPRFQEMKNRLDEVSKNIKEYNPVNFTLSNEEIKSVLAPFYADGIFENRTANDLFGFIESVRSSIYLSSCCVNNSNTPKIYKLNFFNEAFFRFCYAWPVQMMRQSDEFTADQLVNTLRFVYDIFPGKAHLYNAFLSKFSNRFLDLTTQEDASVSKQDKAIFVRTLASIIINEDDSKIVERFLSGILESIQDFSIMQKVWILLGVADLSVEASDEAKLRLKEIKDKLVSIICDDLNKYVATGKSRFSESNLREMRNLPEGVIALFSPKVKGKLGFISSVNPDFTKEIKDIEKLEEVMNSFAVTFGNKSMSLPSREVLAPFFEKVDNFYDKSKAGGQAKVKKLFSEKVVKTLINKKKDILENWDLSDVIALMKYFIMREVKPNEVKNFFAEVLTSKLKYEVELDFAQMVSIWNELPEKYSNQFKAVFENMVDDAVKARLKDTNTAIDFFCEASNMLAASKIAHNAEQKKQKSTPLKKEIEACLWKKLGQVVLVINMFYSKDPSVDPIFLDPFKLAIVQSRQFGLKCIGFVQAILDKFGIVTAAQLFVNNRRSNFISDLYAAVTPELLASLGKKSGTNFIEGLTNGATFSIEDGMEFFVTFDINHCLSVIGTNKNRDGVVSNNPNLGI
jgi:hypothetical protein